MKAKLLSKRPMSGKYKEHWFDAVNDCISVLFEDGEYQDWLGVFGCSDIVQNSVVVPFSVGTAIHVVAGGKGYVVDVNTRSLSYHTPCDWLVDAIAVPGRDLVIGCDYTRLYALSSSEQLWQSDRIALDGIQFLTSAQDHLVGQGWQGITEWSPFTLHFDEWRIEGPPCSYA